MSSNDKINWLSILHSVWPGGLAVAVAAAMIGAGIFGPLQDKIVDKNIAAYDKAHGTFIHSYYLTKDDDSFYDDYGSVDQRKLAAAQKEEAAVVTTIRNAAKQKTLGYIVIFSVVMLLSYILLSLKYGRISISF